MVSEPRMALVFFLIGISETMSSEGLRKQNISGTLFTEHSTTGCVLLWRKEGLEECLKLYV